MYNTFKDGMRAHLEEVSNELGLGLGVEGVRKLSTSYADVWPPQVQAEVANVSHSHLLEALYTAWQDHHTAVKKMKNILIYPVGEGPMSSGAVSGAFTFPSTCRSLCMCTVAKLWTCMGWACCCSGIRWSTTHQSGRRYGRPC